MDTIDLTIDVEALRTQVMEIAQQILAGQHLEVVISGALLLAIIALSLTSIWRNRKRTAVPEPAATGGVMRWLTPKGSEAVTAEQAALVATRPRRKSGANATIKVVTPVSKVTAKLIKSSADPLEIARRSGLSRDGVAMMMATAAPKGASKQSAPANTASSQKPAVRQGGNETGGRAMLAPGAYTQAQHIIPPKTERPGVGTRFNARVS